MPELPEVETIRAQLDKKTPLTILKAEYSKVHQSILKPASKHFDPVGSTISHMNRKGKLLIFSCDDDKYLLSHLGMSGSWRISDKKIKEKHTHIQFETLGKNNVKTYLAYVDPRRFGHLYFYYEAEAINFMNGLGVDIGTDEFTGEYVYTIFKKFPNKVLKPFLLDQKYFAGCGNYIASEICARAGIRPTRKTGKVTKKEAMLIAEVTKTVLDQSIEANGMTFSGGYSDTSGEKGAGVQNLVVFYQEICGLCHQSPVKKIVLQTRGTYYCPKCQK